MFYDILDPNLEVTSAGKPEVCMDVLDDEGNAVPGLFMVTSSEVSLVMTLHGDLLRGEFGYDSSW